MMIRVEGTMDKDSEMVEMSINTEFVMQIVWQIEPHRVNLCLVWIGTGSLTLGIYMSTDDGLRVEHACDEAKQVKVKEVIVTQ